MINATYLRAATERRRIVNADPSNDPKKVWHWGDAKFGQCTVAADAEILTDAYLATVQPDDEVEIDGEFIASIPGAENLDEGIWRFNSSFGIELFAWSDGTVNFGDVDRRQRTTRGQLRALLKGLGLTESGGGE